MGLQRASVEERASCILPTLQKTGPWKKCSAVTRGWPCLAMQRLFHGRCLLWRGWDVDKPVILLHAEILPSSDCIHIEFVGTSQSADLRGVFHKTVRCVLCVVTLHDVKMFYKCLNVSLQWLQVRLQGRLFLLMNVCDHLMCPGVDIFLNAEATVFILQFWRGKICHLCAWMCEILASVASASTPGIRIPVSFWLRFFAKKEDLLMVNKGQWREKENRFFCAFHDFLFVWRANFNGASFSHIADSEIFIVRWHSRHDDREDESAAFGVCRPKCFESAADSHCCCRSHHTAIRCMHVHFQEQNSLLLQKKKKSRVCQKNMNLLMTTVRRSNVALTFDWSANFTRLRFFRFLQSDCRPPIPPRGWDGWRGGGRKYFDRKTVRGKAKENCLNPPLDARGWSLVSGDPWEVNYLLNILLYVCVVVCRNWLTLINAHCVKLHAELCSIFCALYRSYNAAEFRPGDFPWKITKILKTKTKFETFGAHHHWTETPAEG